MSISQAEQFSKKIRGPVFPILTLFNNDGSIDKEGIKNYVNFLIAEGAKNLMCTVGTSRYDVMTTEEMLEVNKLVVDAVAKRAYVIVTTPSFGPTTQAIGFAKNAEKIGADAILAVYPDRFYGEDGIYEFFENISTSCGIGIMVHEMAIRAGRSTEAPASQYSPSLLKRIFDLPNLVGLKEESGDEFLIDHINSNFNNKLAVIGGRGGMNGYRQAYAYGQKTYLVGIGNFLPKLELDFYSHMVNKDFDRADQIINTIEKPFFEATVKIGWHISLRTAMYIKGLCKPFERRPLKQLTNDNEQAVRELMLRLKLID